MVINKTGRTLPFSCEQLFDLVAEIERYPEFLPGWRSARINKRAGNTCYVSQEFALGPLQVQLDSQATLLRPSQIDITSSDPRFRTCRCLLRVLPVEPARCRLSIEANLVLNSDLLQALLNHVESVSLDSIMAAFEARAHQLYQDARSHGKPEVTLRRHAGSARDSEH
jgi:coenzyme Q-binding protein COQ10